MSDKSRIEWTDATWNPVTGCTKVSPGCANCYAERFAERFRGIPGHHYEHGFDLQLRPEMLDQPFHWAKPRHIFVCSMADLFHKDVPDEFIDQVFAVMALAPRHTFQVLTKRPERMAEYVSGAYARVRAVVDEPSPVRRAYLDSLPRYAREEAIKQWWTNLPAEQWPLPNVWVGTSVENQRVAFDRVSALLQTPGNVRFISAEPLLGPLDLEGFFYAVGPSTAGPFTDAIGRRRLEFGYGGIGGQMITAVPTHDIAWLIVGGESGPGARPMHPDWARSLRDQATEAGVAFLFKQWGEFVHVMPAEDRREPNLFVSDTGHVGTKEQALDLGWSAQGMWRVGKKAAGRELDGRTWDEYPHA
jgi:protein gp37